MKLKFIIPGVMAIALIIIAAISIGRNRIDYSDFRSARGGSKTVQVIGSWVREKPTNYAPEQNEFTFSMKDGNGEEAQVVFSGAMPQTFQTATSVVVKGKFVGERFAASELLTKCPSKYESQGTEHRGNAEREAE